MNKVYLFGKILAKSKLKYIIQPKLKIYIMLVVQTIDNNEICCIVPENLCDNLKHTNINKHIYILGRGIYIDNKFSVLVEEMYY